MKPSINLRAHRALFILLALTAIPLATTGFAHAASNTGPCADTDIEYSTDGGQTWTTNGRMDDAPHPRLDVRLAGFVQPGCRYQVSLASYSAQGPSWQTSGTQTFLGWDTTTLDSQTPTATLNVSAHAPTCFGQLDLYGNGLKYDGIQGPLPKYPNAVIAADLITAWNGAISCGPTPSAPGLPPISSPTPSSSQPSTPMPIPSPRPPGSEPGTPTPNSSTQRPGSASAVVGTPPPTGTGLPVGRPVVPPVPPTGKASLAFTGTDGTAVIAIASSAIALLALGGLCLRLACRRATGG